MIINRNRFILSISATMFVSNVHAQCVPGSETVFSCVTKNGKQIQVCDAGQTIVYSFGKPRNPEIVLEVPRNQASTSQWSGVGHYLSYSVDIPNGNTTYSVVWNADKLTEEHAITGGVNVIIDGETKATVECYGEDIVQNIEGIDLKPTE